MAIRAAVRTVDPEKRTVEMVMSTGAKVLRNGWDGPFYEELSLEKKHVRMKRINNGAPLLNAHGAGWMGPTLDDQIGVVESAILEENKAIVGTVRFPRAEDDPKADQLFRKVADGIIRNVSIGYRTYRLEKVESGAGTIPVFRATDWEPFETSLVPMGADDGGKIRGDQVQPNACHVVAQIATRSAAPPSKQPVTEVTKEPNMNEERSETIAEQPDEAPANPPPPTPEENEREAGAIVEQERIEGIRSACLAARLPRSYEDKLIRDRKLTLVMARGMVLDELRKRGGDDRGPGRSPSGASEVIVGDDPLIHKRKGITGALLHRVAPEMFKLDDEAREYRGMGLLDIAEVFLRAQGVRITSMSKMERAAAALGMATRAHTTSDFPLLLADVANKVLRAAYEAAPQTWVPLAKMVPLSDFKPSKQLQVGDAPQLLEVLEHGEFTAGSIAEAKEEIKLKTFGRIFHITRQALINDDTNAFADVPAAFGRSARTKESDLAWAEITGNPAMGDGVVLFHTATHKNLSATSDAISVASIGAARASLRQQTAIDGVTLMNLSPNFLVVPAGKETIADQFVSAALMASAPGSINPFAGRLQVLSEPRLDVASATAWYLATNPAQCPILLHGTLDGQAGPQVDQEVGFDVDGLKIKCRLDVAFKAADWRGIFKNPGA